jgi:hypothetical protein
MQLIQKTAALFAFSLLSACQPALQDSCKNETLCAYAIQEQDTLYLFVANRTNSHVVIPRIEGLDTPYTRFRLEPVEQLTDEMQCEVTLAMTLGSDPEPFPLNSYQVAGMAITTDQARKSYCLPKGCRDFRISFDILKAAEHVTSGPLRFESHIVNLCM